MLGFAAGVMLAASFWSLLAPAIELAGSQGVPSWVPAAVGLVLGGLFLRVVDALLPHLHPGYPRDAAEGVATRWHRTTLMVTAITLHNIPEGLAVGVAFGAVSAGLELNGAITLSGALALTIGIAIQNFPEGVAVAMPIRAMGVSRASARSGSGSCRRWSSRSPPSSGRRRWSPSGPCCPTPWPSPPGP